MAFRLFCCFMLPIVFGAIAHLLFSRTALELGGDFGKLVTGLYAEGKLKMCIRDSCCSTMPNLKGGADQ